MTERLTEAELLEALRTPYHDGNQMYGETPESDSIKATAGATMWAKHGDSFFPCEDSVDKLDAGQYTIDATNQGIFFTKKKVVLDDLIQLPDSSSQEVLDEIKVFWEREEVYRRLKVTWKRGVLLWGPPGSGKTTTVQLLSKMIVDMGGISVYCTAPRVTASGLDAFRRIEPDRPVVVILEDLDAIIHNYGEPDLLALLDGELQIDNVVFVATTNYPEKLDKRIVNRPSRFDIVKKVPMPSKEARKIYLLEKNPRLAESEITKVDPEKELQLNELSDDIIELEDAVASVDSKAIKESIKTLKTSLRSADNAMKADVSEDIQDLETVLESHKAKKAELAEAKKKASSLKKELNTKIPEIDSWVELTENYSIAHIKELVLSVECYNRPLKETIARLDSMISKQPTSGQSATKAGF